MTQKHTPGPWKITEDDYGHEHWFGGAGEGQICVNGWVNGGCKKYPSKWRKLQANARLIAAAPELLEALKDLLETFEAEIHCEYNGTSMLYEKLSYADGARAAIAKATNQPKE